MTTAQTIQITMSRGMDGNGPLRAKSTIPLGFDRRELVVETRKNSMRGGISCNAQVMQVSEDGRTACHAFSARPGCGDFSRMIAHDPAARATEKSLQTMHRAALEGIDQLLVDAKSFYAGRQLTEDAGHAVA